MFNWRLAVFIVWVEFVDVDAKFVDLEAVGCGFVWFWWWCKNKKGWGKDVWFQGVLLRNGRMGKEQRPEEKKSRAEKKSERKAETVRETVRED